MNLGQALSAYLSLQLLLAGAALAFWLFQRVAKGKNYSALLKMHYGAITLAVGLVCLQPLLPGRESFVPAAKVWSASSLHSSPPKDHPPGTGYLTLARSPQKIEWRTDRLLGWWLVLAAAIIIFGMARLTRDFRALRRIRRESFLLRRYGRVSVYVHGATQVPFSCRLFGAWVVMPAALLAQPEHFRLALRHELQHHRQGDTLWVYPIYALKLACAWNPAAHWWMRQISEVQEFACDETLLGQRKVNPQAYARCLIGVAESAFLQKRMPACATGLTFLVERNLTKRRVTMMLRTPKKQARTLTLTFCAAMAALLVSTAFAAKGLVQDRRISLTEAQALAEKSEDGAFPIVVNDLVLAQLNSYVGTPEGREFMRQSLRRLELYRGMVQEKIDSHQMPRELLAIPIVESGYQNLPERNRAGWGAGLWMFIRSTALAYGLRVDEQVDERLDEVRLTEAAMRYFKSNYRRFGDWQLATLAYNIGENNVDRAIERTGSRDAWVLVRSKFENDRNYLAKVMAAILVMKNPGLVD